MKDPLEEAGSDVTRRGAGISLLLVLLGLIVLAVFRPSTIDTLAIIFGIVALIMLHEAGHYFTATRAGMKVTETSTRIRKRQAGTPSTRNFRLVYHYLRLLVTMLSQVSRPKNRKEPRP